MKKLAFLYKCMPITYLKFSQAIPPVMMMMMSTGGHDHSADLPDECLAGIFEFLGEFDRNSCSAVCRRWLLVERQTRKSLSLIARSDLSRSVSKLFSRFTAVTVLSLKCDRHVSIGDDGLTLISLHCTDLTSLKLSGCREITHIGMSNFALNRSNLKKLSCHWCSFGAKAMNAVLNHCALEVFSVKRLQGIDSGIDAEPIGPGTAAFTLEKICLKGILNAQCFSKLLAGSKKLRSIKLFWCFGDLDGLLQSISNKSSTMVEIHLKWIRMSNIGIVAISNYSFLEKLHVVRAKGNERNSIDDKGLIAIGEKCVKLKELILIGANPTCLSLCLIGRNCSNLEKMVLSRSETVGDDELKCIGDEFLALKKLWIRDCAVTNRGVEAIVNGCSNLVKFKVSSCRDVTVDCLRGRRRRKTILDVYLDSMDGDDEDSSSCDESDKSR